MAFSLLLLLHCSTACRGAVRTQRPTAKVGWYRNDRAKTHADRCAALTCFISIFLTFFGVSPAAALRLVRTIFAPPMPPGTPKEIMSHSPEFTYRRLLDAARMAVYGGKK